MPSHVTHLLFAHDVVERSRHAGRLGTLLRRRAHPFLILGAQGPDIFYHNQRRRPTGLAYGSLMHRRAYGRAVASMWVAAREAGLEADSWAGGWVLGFASHAILDRHTHPYINARAGWPVPGEPDTERFRYMHPFLERLIDVSLLEAKGGKHPNDIDFFSQVDCGADPPDAWVDLMTRALTATYAKAADDTRLADRLRSAYLDTMGYYRFTNFVDGPYLEEGLRREEAEDARRRWLSIVHPPNVPTDIDVLNLSHREWPHPCSSHERSTKSFPDLYAGALDEGVAMVDRIVAAWDEPTDSGRSIIETAVGNWNLSDGRPTERPCPRRHADPLPLYEVQERIRESIRRGRGGRLE